MLTAKEVIENIDKYCDGGYYQINEWNIFIFDTEELGWVIEPEVNGGESYLISYEVLCEIKEFVEWLKGRVR